MSPLEHFAALVRGVKNASAYRAALCERVGILCGTKKVSATVDFVQFVVTELRKDSQKESTIESVINSHWSPDRFPASRGAPIRQWQEEPFRDYVQAIAKHVGEDRRDELNDGMAAGDELMGIDDQHPHMDAREHVDFLAFTYLCTGQLRHFIRLTRGTYPISDDVAGARIIRAHPRFEKGLYSEWCTRDLRDFCAYCQENEEERRQEGRPPLTLDEIRRMVRHRWSTPYKINGVTYLYTGFGLMSQLVRDVLCSMFSGDQAAMAKAVPTPPSPSASVQKMEEKLPELKAWVASISAQLRNAAAGVLQAALQGRTSNVQSLAEDLDITAALVQEWLSQIRRILGDDFGT
jgi:hypothetical protein